jgi:hypothetical protein
MVNRMRQSLRRTVFVGRVNARRAAYTAARRNVVRGRMRSNVSHAASRARLLNRRRAPFADLQPFIPTPRRDYIRRRTRRS